MPLANSTSPWRRELRIRYRAHPLLKSLLIPIFMSGFFAAYFYLLRHPFFAITIVPATALDRLIPFQPAALVLYVSLWPYVVIGAGTVHGLREIKLYCTGVLVLMVLGLGTFLFWPTATPQPDIDWTRHPSFQFLKNVDASANACPSLHVAFAVFTALWLDRLLRAIQAPAPLRAINAAWALAIAYSTIATRQHVAIDVLAGTVLGGLAGLLDPRPRPTSST